MSQQHMQFEEESRGNPSYQIGYAPHDEYERPQLSYDYIHLPGQKSHAESPGSAPFTPSNLVLVDVQQIVDQARSEMQARSELNRLRVVLALLSLFVIFVLALLMLVLMQPL